MDLMNLDVQDSQLDAIAGFCRGNPSFDMSAWICAVQMLKDGGATRTISIFSLILKFGMTVQRYLKFLLKETLHGIVVLISLQQFFLLHLIKVLPILHFGSKQRRSRFKFQLLVSNSRRLCLSLQPDFPGFILLQ